MPKYTLEQRLQKINEFKEDLREVRKWERELVNKINRNRRALPGGKYMKPLKSVRTQVIPEPRSYVKSFTAQVYVVEKGLFRHFWLTTRFFDQGGTGIFDTFVVKIGI